MKVEKVLLLGGTREAVALAAKLVAEGHDVTTSLAGRTKEPRKVAGKLRVGGFGGVDGLVRWLNEQRITRLIDATHPFAETISKNAASAASATGVSFERHQRPPWEQAAGDNWRHVADLKEAAASLSGGSVALLALGSQYLSAFEDRKDIRFIVRMIDPPTETLPFEDFELVLSRPSTQAEVEAEFLKAHKIDVVVCRNSGGAGAYAKIEAARLLGIPVAMVARPTDQDPA